MASRFCEFGPTLSLRVSIRHTLQGSWTHLTISLPITRVDGNASLMVKSSCTTRNNNVVAHYPATPLHMPFYPVHLLTLLSTTHSSHWRPANHDPFTTIPTINIKLHYIDSHTATILPYKQQHKDKLTNTPHSSLVAGKYNHKLSSLAAGQRGGFHTSALKTLNDHFKLLPRYIKTIQTQLHTTIIRSLSTIIHNKHKLWNKYLQPSLEVLLPIYPLSLSSPIGLLALPCGKRPSGGLYDGPKVWQQNQLHMSCYSEV